MVKALLLSLLLVGCSKGDLKVDLKVTKTCKSDKWSVSYCKLVNKNNGEVCYRAEAELSEGTMTFTIPCTFYEGI